MPNRRKRTKRSSGRRRGGRGGMLQPTGAVCDVKMPGPMAIPPQRTTSILLRATSAISTDGSGVLAFNIPFDPNATLSATYLSGAKMFVEFADYQALYGEIKVQQFEVTICPTQNYDSKGSGNDITPLAIGTNLSAIYVTPSNINGVMDNANSQLYPMAYDSSGRGRFHSVRFRPGAWALTGNPNPGGSGTGISAGCPGYFTFYANTGVASQIVGFVRICGRYTLRSRV